MIGYYPALIYNQMFPYAGTEFAKKGIDMNNYFIHEDVSDVYTTIMDFQDNIQPAIDKLLFQLWNRKIENIAVDIIDIMWLRSIPYFIYEKAVYFGQTYNDIIKHFNVENELQKIIKSVE